MADQFTRRWRWPLAVLAGLILVAVALVLTANHYYDRDAPDSFKSTLATDVLLSGAVVALLGAVVATVLSTVAEVRSSQAADADKRLELFRRMRDTHLRVVQIQQVLRARRDPDTYHKQMHTLQKAVKDMGEIREEVKVSSRLYDTGDRRLIIMGIDQLSIYLHRGVSEYFEWCDTVEPPNTPEKRPGGAGSWVVDLVAEPDGAVPRRHEARTDAQPGDEDYAPPGGMPPEYEDGLERSKLIMRLYVYEPSRKKRADKRHKILKGIDEREARTVAARRRAGVVPR